MEIEKWIPGVKVLKSYQTEWLRKDIFAGLSVAAVALPIGIAYAQLGGFHPVVGIYSCILPPIAYALFGSSRQLVVNPDAAACTIVASTLAPLAAGDINHYLDLSIILSFIAGILCIVGGFIKLGVIADFLSRPILTGYLNGIAISIVASQIGTLIGIRIPPLGFFKTIYYAFLRMDEIHIYNFLFGLILLIILLLLERFVPKTPNFLLVVALACTMVYFMDLHKLGVEVVGEIPGGLPTPKIPSVKMEELWPLFLSAFGIVLVSFCSMMTTARSFATKGKYTIDVNRDMIALGMSNVASGLNRGFVVSGADSRTAVAYTTGGKTQVASVIASITMLLILLFFTGPLSYVPKVALAATLITSSLSLFNFKSLYEYRKINKMEFWLSLLTTLGVMTIGVLPGVLVAVGIAIFLLLRAGSRPHDETIGLVKGKVHVFESINEKDVEQIKDLLIYRFDSALLFYNADRFRQRIRKKVELESPKWVLFDAEAVPVVDITGAHVMEELYDELREKGITFAISRTSKLFDIVIERSGLMEKMGNRIYPTIHAGVNAFEKDQKNKHD